MQMSSIYGLTAPGDPPAIACIRYVGKTKNPINTRLRSHINHAYSRRTKVSCWIRSLLEKGQRPQIHLLAVIPTEISDNAEIGMKLFMDRFGAKLLNLTDGGDGPNNLAPEVRENIRKALTGKKLTLECRKKLSASLIGNKNSAGRTDLRGKKKSEIAKQRMREAWKLRKTPEWLELFRASRRNFKFSPQVLAGISAKVSASLIGNKRSLGTKQSEESKRKKSLALKGRKMSDITKARMSAWQKGVPKSSETKAKIRDS
jgi:hypothetical protein